MLPPCALHSACSCVPSVPCGCRGRGGRRQRTAAQQRCTRRQQCRPGRARPFSHGQRVPPCGPAGQARNSCPRVQRGAAGGSAPWGLSTCTLCVDLYLYAVCAVLCMLYAVCAVQVVRLAQEASIPELSALPRLPEPAADAAGGSPPADWQPVRLVMTVVQELPDGSKQRQQQWSSSQAGGAASPLLQVRVTEYGGALSSGTQLVCTAARQRAGYHQRATVRQRWPN